VAVTLSREELARGYQMGHLANRMRSLASTGNPRAAELIERADELDKMINANLWDTAQVLGAQLLAQPVAEEIETAAHG
jgi:hypothetical protein